MVTPEIVAQMGFVPRGLYERKLTVGQQRRPRAKKPAQRGGAGSLNSWNDNYTLLGLQKYAKHHNIDDSGTKGEIAVRLAHKSAMRQAGGARASARQGNALVDQLEALNVPASVPKGRAKRQKKVSALEIERLLLQKRFI